MGYIKRQSQAALVEKYRMVGESEAFLDCMELVSKTAKVNRPVLIIGERGTGKELVAARLHYLSRRWQQPRITINCAAFAPELLESELFGHEQGAFTGAVRKKPGRFELAHGGSMFLDELANAPMALQEKLLRVIEYQEFERLGGVDTVEVDVRVIAATNRDLPALCREGKFKEDLLDRLSFEVITLPPLRERQEDILLLTKVFAGNMAFEIELPGPPKFADRALARLLSHSWPGNVRELKNVVERAVFHYQDDMIQDVILDPFESPYRPCTTPAGPGSPAPKPLEEQTPVDLPGTLPEAVITLERNMVTQALERNQFHQRKTADELGLSYYQLRRIMKRLDLP